MKKLKLFIENFLVYGLGGIISKIIPLVMVPIVTRLMPNTEYYGVSDLSNTIVNLASSLAIMGMYDAMFRMFFERDEETYKKRVCSTALVFTIGTSLVVFLLMILLRNQISELFLRDTGYAYVIYFSALATLVGATNSIVSAPTRMQNRRGIFLITNTIGPILSYSVAIPMLLKGHYIIALPLAAVISGVFLEAVFGILNRKWFSVKLFDSGLLKQLLEIAVPLLPIFLIYWLFSSLSKVLISNMIGVGAEGVYSVGSKFGQASQLIYLAFAGGWQFFAFSTMREENQVRNNSLVFEYLGIISFAATAFVCALSHPLFMALFQEEYLPGYIVTPYLFLSPLLLMLFQVACNQFLVIKKTWPNLLILTIGALLCVAANYALIPVLGIEGAAIATLIGYTVSVIVCVLVLNRMKLMELSGRFAASACLMAGFVLLWRFFFRESPFVGTAAAAVLTIVYLFLYRKDLKRMLEMIKMRRSGEEDAAEEEV